MAATQEQRELAFFSPLGEDVLLFHRMVGTEGLSQLFEYEVELQSEDHNIQPEDVLGQNVCVRLQVGEERERFFNGFASRFSYLGSDASLAHYRIVLRPWLWLLCRTTDCRVFQNKTVRQIVEDCCREHGFTDFEFRLGGDYQEHEYRVQYKEPLCQFLCRLMEEEGIYFYFTHERDKHTLVCADSISSHDLIPDCEEVPFYPPSESRPAHRRPGRPPRESVRSADGSVRSPAWPGPRRSIHA